MKFNGKFCKIEG